MRKHLSRITEGWYTDSSGVTLCVVKIEGVWFAVPYSYVNGTPIHAGWKLTLETWRELEVLRPCEPTA